ncbi:MAG: molybdenum cofactor biosynthesis protein MoaB [Candidatus Bathyarchaeota archaeon]|nr:MAG: molybdenum cofactor biosynthesis protein MoaB [Candidatus Bathyarchaeota archaeon]
MSETAKKHKAEAPEKLGFAVFVCSSSRFKKWQKRGKIDDPSGDLIVKLLEGAGHGVALRGVLPDDGAVIHQGVLKALGTEEVDAIIACGGTGVGARDVTIEAVKPLLEKELPGFGELFRRLSYDEIGSAASMSRALAGVAKGKAVFVLPGSPQAVRLCVERLILPEASHIVKHTRE